MLAAAVWLLLPSTLAADPRCFLSHTRGSFVDIDFYSFMLVRWERLQRVPVPFRMPSAAQDPQRSACCRGLVAATEHSRCRSALLSLSHTRCSFVDIDFFSHAAAARPAACCGLVVVAAARGVESASDRAPAVCLDVGSSFVLHALAAVFYI